MSRVATYLGKPGQDQEFNERCSWLGGKCSGKHEKKNRKNLGKILKPEITEVELPLHQIFLSYKSLSPSNDNTVFYEYFWGQL